MRVQVLYDQNFANEFQGAATSKIEGIFALGRGMMSHESLGTVFRPEITGITQVNRAATATGSNLK